jgi:hypothetical protein
VPAETSLLAEFVYLLATFLPLPDDLYPLVHPVLIRDFLKIHTTIPPFAFSSLSSKGTQTF